MFSDKKNVLQLVALLKAYNIQHIVCAPGSRNSPLVHSFANDEFFTCYSIVDERSAGFFAIGIIQEMKQPVAVCCTSGTAVLNLASSVAEAYYQQLPLLVITADRPASWVNQMDGQTIPQTAVFNSFIKKTVSLPEIHTDEDEWFCNRLVNEAIIALEQHGNGPSHINVPLSEPLFQFTASSLPEVRKIRYRSAVATKENWNEYRKRLKDFNRCMIVAGQSVPDKELNYTLDYLSKEQKIVVLAEYTSNVENDSAITNFDALLVATEKEKRKEYAPELLITIGGHITSKRLKELIRKNPPKEHWHVTPTGEVADTFQCVTDIIEVQNKDISLFLRNLKEEAHTGCENYFSLWQTHSHKLLLPEMPYSDLYITREFMLAIPSESILHLASSSSVRHAQLFRKTQQVEVYSNRGTNGIDGSVSTAVGFSALSEKLVFLLTGDLGFFYDMNGLWNSYTKSNLRILLNNNGGGEIFHVLLGLNKSESLNSYIATQHHTNAKGWAESVGFDYIAIHNEQELQEFLPVFINPDHAKPILMEAFTSIDSNAEIIRSFYHSLKIL